MDTYPLILLANEPGTFRSLLASELPLLRPNLRVQEIDAATLDAAVKTFHPSVVICSQPIAQAYESELSILILYFGEEEAFILPQNGAGQVIVNPRLSDILAAIDSALLAQPS
jgi:hypothetical protein